MSKNVKSIFLVATLLFLLVGVSAINASEVSDDTTVLEDTGDTTVLEDTGDTIASEVTTTTTDNRIVDTTTKNIKTEEQSTDYYVSDTSGSDDNSGTNDSPLKTLQGALNKTTAEGTYNIHIAEGTYKGLGNTNLTVNGDYKINIIGEGMNKTVFDGEAKYKISTGTVWGSDDYWNPYDYQNANYFLTITEGMGHITLSNFNIERMASIGGTSIYAYPHATIDNYADLTVDNIFFYYNMAGVGSAIRNHRSGTVLMTNCLLSENRKSSSSGNDGVIYNNGTIIIENTIFDHNAGRWGVILNDHVLTIKDSTLKNGVSYDLKSTYKFGSGIASNSGNADYFHQYDMVDVETIIENVTFENNGQTDIYQGNGLLKVNNCNFYNSSGIYFENVNPSIEGVINGSTFKDMGGSTIFGSLSNDDSSIFAIYTVGGGSLLIENNTITSDNKGIAVYVSDNKTIQNNNMSNIIVIAGTNNIVKNNYINTSNQAYGIQIGVDKTLSYNTDASNNTIENNKIYASILTGQKAIKDNEKGNIINNNIPESGAVIVLNNENYAQYFDENGVNRENVFVNGSIIYVEDLTGKDLIFDNVKIALTSYNTTNSGKSVLNGSNIIIHPNAKVMLNKLRIFKDSQKDNIVLINSTGNYIENVQLLSEYQTHLISITADENYINNLTLNFNGTSDFKNDSIVKINSSNNEIKVRVYIYSQRDKVFETTAITVNNSQNNNIYLIESLTNTTDNINMLNIRNSKNTNINFDNPRLNSKKNINLLNIFNSTDSIIYSASVNVNSNTNTLLNITASNNTYYATKTLSSNSIGSSINIKSTNNTLITIDDSINTTVTSSLEFSNIFVKSDESRLFKINNSNNTHIQLMKIYEEKTNNNEAMIKFTNSNNNIISGVEIKNINNSTNTTNNANTFIHLVNSTNNTINNYELDDYIFETTLISNDTSIILDNSDNNIIKGTNITSNNNYTIVLTNSNNNQIINNVLKGNQTQLLGDDSILNNGHDNVLNNTPIRKRLSNDNYDELFNNSTYKYGDSEIIISSDLYDKDLIFPERVDIKNPDNYTLYNTTLTVNKDNSIIENLKLDSNKNITTLITINGDNCVLENITINHENEGITRTIVNNAEEIDFNYLNITTIGSEIETTDNIPSIISIYSQNDVKINNSYIYTTYNNYDQKGTSNSIQSNHITITNSNITTIGNNKAIGINTTKGESHQNTIEVESNTTAIGRIGHINETEGGVYNRINYTISTITVKSNDTAIGQINDFSLYSIMNVYADKLAIGLMEINDTSWEMGQYNQTINVISNQTAYGVYFKNSGIDMRSMLPITFFTFWESCDINVQAVNVTGIYAENINGSGLSIGNNMQLNGENIIGIYLNNITTYSLRSIEKAKIIIEANNYTQPVYSNHIRNGKTPTGQDLSIKNTYIILKNFNQTEPIITINDSVKVSIQNNYLLSDGVYGENAISVNATSSTIKNNKPANLNSLETIIETTGFDNLYRDENNLTIRVIDYYDTPMNGTVNINFGNNEQSFENIQLTNGTANLLFTPNATQQQKRPRNLTTSISFSSTNPTYQSQSSSVKTNIPYQHDITLTTSDITEITNKQIEITINVVDDFNRPVNEGRISYYDEEDNLLGESEVVDGVATFKTTFNQPYNGTIKSIYNGTYLYNNSSADSLVTIVNPELIVNPITATVGDTINITANIVAFNEIVNDINTGKITFKVNGKTLKDANGKVIYAKVVNGTATISDYIIPDTWEENSSIQAVYSGSTQCMKLTSEKTEITITPKELTLTTENTIATIGSTTTLTATLSDNTINTGKVVFKINGKTVKDANGKVIYAKVVNGQVSVEYTIPENMKAKDYTLTATYISSDYRLEDTKTLTITA